MQHFVKVLSAGLCALGVILSLGGRALCSQQQSSATSYAYFSMGLPAPARALPPPPQYEYAPAPAPASKVQVEEEEEVGGEYGIGEYDDGEYDGGEYGGGEYDGGENGDIEHDVHPRYSFKYGVEDHHTGDVKDQAEERDGDVVRGEYSLLQPDGRRRVVHYTASKHGGFNAVVSYVGQAVRPEDHDQDLDRHQYYNR